MSEKTARVHLTNIMNKLGVRSIRKLISVIIHETLSPN
ncbi:LuxR C-terminal-related transcriptional regulator [Paenibacillus sp. N3.4]|nr:response regulator transcription factor [Paenibacillus sp. N3.4]